MPHRIKLGEYYLDREYEPRLEDELDQPILTRLKEKAMELSDLNFAVTLATQLGGQIESEFPDTGPLISLVP